MARSSSYSWMPGWLRKFLNLDDELPGYGPSSYGAGGDYTPPPRQPPSYTPPPAPRYTPTFTPSAGAAEAPRRYTPSSPPPAPSASAPPDPAAPPRGASAAPPPAPPRTLGPTGTVQPDGTVGPGGDVPRVATEGYVQPVGYLLRSYARGALPPQGLEQFTREFRATLTDVWNFYSYWTRFQTDELVRIGREAMDVVVDNLPAGAEPAAGTTSVRRIKVTVGNGEKQADPVATTVDPPPAPTPAAPPAPPAPTARFSPTVTADDAEVPPEGRDPAADFAARMAATAAEVQSDVAAASARAADEAAEAADEATDTAKELTDRAKGPGEDTKGAR